MSVLFGNPCLLGGEELENERERERMRGMADTNRMAKTGAFDQLRACLQSGSWTTRQPFRFELDLRDFNQ